MCEPSCDCTILSMELLLALVFVILWQASWNRLRTGLCCVACVLLLCIRSWFV